MEEQMLSFGGGIPMITKYIIILKGAVTEVETLC